MEGVNLKTLTKTEIFAGASEEEVASMLNCLSAKKRKYQKDEIIFHAGDTVASIGVMLTGSALIENDDIWGNRSVLDYVKEGQIFAETYACALDEKLMVNVIAMSDCEVLFLDVRKILKVCPNACEFHQNLVQNLLAISAQKNLNLSRRIFHTSSKTIRGRLLSYLSYQAMECGKNEFDIPYNRQQLADYLGVDRSAMSNELGKMQKDGLIEVKRNHFRILDVDVTA